MTEQINRNNSICVLKLPDIQSGPRHGGVRMERRHEIYINGYLFESHWERSESSFRWATGEHYNKGLAQRIKHLETVLECKTIFGKKK